MHMDVRDACELCNSISNSIIIAITFIILISFKIETDVHQCFPLNGVVKLAWNHVHVRALTDVALIG